MKEIELKLEGLHCPMCETYINDLVRKAGQVKKVKTSHTKQNCLIVCDENIDPQIFIDAISKSGYKVLSSDSHPYKKHFLFFK